MTRALYQAREEDLDRLVWKIMKKQKGDTMLRVGEDKVINLRIFAEQIEVIYDYLMKNKGVKNEKKP